MGTLGHVMHSPHSAIIQNTQNSYNQQTIDTNIRKPCENCEFLIEFYGGKLANFSLLGVLCPDASGVRPRRPP